LPEKQGKAAAVMRRNAANTTTHDILDNFSAEHAQAFRERRGNGGGGGGKGSVSGVADAGVDVQDFVVLREREPGKDGRDSLCWVTNPSP